jgi:hypothetical protein
MTSKQVLEAMQKGAVLCMEYDGQDKVYWLEPKRIIIRSNVAEAILTFPNLKSGGDSLFRDTPCQTWRL